MRSIDWIRCVGVAFLCCILATAHAQSVHKCVKDGKTTFQSVPCDGAVVVPKAAATTGGAPVSTPQTGYWPWAGLRGGMAIDEVQRITGAALRPGQEVALQRSGVTLAGSKFDVTYSFGADKALVGVHLSLISGLKAAALDFDSNEAVFASYEQALASLVRQYGAPASQSLKNKASGFPGLSANTEWQAAGGKLFASISPVTAQTAMLNIGLHWRDARRS